MAQSRCLLLFISGFLLVSCGSQFQLDNAAQDGGNSSSIFANPPEAPYCGQPLASPGNVTISGRALYQFRIGGNGAISDGQAGRPGPNPIRFAEVHVVDGSGNIVQCTETDSNGHYSFQVGNGSYSVLVISRSLNANLQASVLNNPNENKYYQSKLSFTAATSQNLSDLVAPADGSLEGGAFNILDQMLNANIWLRTATANCSSSFPECKPFQVAPKIQAYWTRGFNPGTYFGGSAISFYLHGQSQLFILGGLNGDVDNSDDDHFDNSVIIHEYGHFIEDMFARTSSPGGSHNGNSIIDPRLAWGEGWANFFQASVTGIPVYRDTYGTPKGMNGVFLNENLENPQHDLPANPGEGLYHEFSISRALWDIIDPHPISHQGTNEGPGTDNVTAPFFELWTVFTSEPNGFRSTTQHFRNSALFLKLHANLSGEINDFSSVIQGEKQASDLRYYATPLVISSTSCPQTIQATDPSEDGTFLHSNQFSSNRFFDYNHPGGPLDLNLSYTSASISAPADLDLYLYNENYVYGNLSTTAGYSNKSNDNGHEEVSVNLPAGHYIVNVMVYTGNGLASDASFNLTANGQTVCPSF